MPNLIYRVVSACGGLGFGFPSESLNIATRGRVDAIIADAGTVDAGPYYLGAGTQFDEHEALKSDFRRMVVAGNKLACPVIIGSCGTAGGSRHLEHMAEIAKEIFSEADIKDAKVALIRADLNPELVVEEFRKGALRATGFGPDLDEQTLRKSTIVGQMGVHPLITALEGGAQYVLAGRACDVALFASDMIRRGIDPGLAYHVGHVLACGARACEPSSASDCLVAEIYDDASAVFTAPNRGRRCTIHSIAAHALYEEGHAQLQFYPEGVLAMAETELFSRDSRAARIRNSRFVRADQKRPLSIKLEGAVRLGARKVSVIHIDPEDLTNIPDDCVVYGRNGVQAAPFDAPEDELGVIVEALAKSQEAAVRLVGLLARHLSYHAYSGRKNAAGSLAFPLSPNFATCGREDGMFSAIIVGGSRDPVFLANYATVKAAVIKLVEEECTDILAEASYTIVEANASNPAILLRTVDPDPKELRIRHLQEIERISQLAMPKASSRVNYDAPDAYAWSLYHLLHNEDIIKNELFPITYYQANGATWIEEGKDRGSYHEIGEIDYAGDLDDRTLSLIADVSPRGEPIGTQRLIDMATMIRSKDASVNRLTFDVIFNSGENYEAALYSNVFNKDNIAKILRLPSERVLGTFFVDACNAIKITIDRPNISASVDERDVFGVQQHAALERLSIPIYTAALGRASAF